MLSNFSQSLIVRVLRNYLSFDDICPILSPSGDKGSTDYGQNLVIPDHYLEILVDCFTITNNREWQRLIVSDYFF